MDKNIGEIIKSIRQIFIIIERFLYILLLNDNLHI